MTATSNFLIPNGTFIVELVAFLIVLLVIGRYVLPWLNARLTERQEMIRAELAAADEARSAAAEQEEKRRQALEEARDRARQIVDQANRTAEQVRSEAQVSAQQERDRILGAATQEIDLARQQAVEQAATRMGELVLDVVERVIGREVTAQDHRDLIDEGIAAVVAEPGAILGQQPSGAGAGTN